MLVLPCLPRILCTLAEPCHCGACCHFVSRSSGQSGAHPNARPCLPSPPTCPAGLHGLIKDSVLRPLVLPEK